MRFTAFLFAFTFTGLSIPSFATSLSVNGTCEAGTCSSTDILNPGQSASSPFSFVYTFANSDRYQATGNLSATFNSPYNSITAANITLTYLGNSTGTGSAQDVLSVLFSQNFNDSSFGAAGSNNSGYEYLSGTFSGAYANATSVTGQAFSANNTAMALLGPFGPPNPFEKNASNQPFSYEAVTPLTFRDTITFGAGSGDGATVSVANVPVSPTSPVPEPASWVLLSSGLALIGALRSRRL